MSAFKKVVGLVTGASAVAVIGVAVAQSVPPNPINQSGSEGAGSQTVHMTPIGETGVLAEAPMEAQPVATLTKENEQASVAPQPAEPVAQAAPAPAPETNVAQANTLPPPSNQNELGAGPSEPAPKHDRG
jgi:hypothetical protein